MIQSGMILIWSGAIEDIPDGYHLCNGGAGTPDLRELFVIGAGDVLAPGATGGSETHHHHIDTAWPELAVGMAIKDATPDGYYDRFDDGHAHGGDTGDADTRPPWYALAYIMKT